MSAPKNAGIPTAPPAGVQAGKTDGAHFAVNREQVTRAATAARKRQDPMRWHLHQPKD